MIDYRRSLEEDDWSAIFRPPKNESLDEKQARILRQQEAARISKEIDDAIERSRRQYEKRKRAIKLLLLGQAESGKSTMLRNFQLAFCPTYFLRETPVWKVIIQLNLIGSVKKLLAIIEDELESQALSHSSRSHLHPQAIPPGSPKAHNEQFGATPPRSSASSSHAPPTSPISPISPSTLTPTRHNSIQLQIDSDDLPLTQAHAALRLRLLPLLSVEKNLARQLHPDYVGESPSAPSSTGWTKWASGAGDNAATGFLFGDGEICVRAGGAWKSILERVAGTLSYHSDNDEDAVARPPSALGKNPSRSARPHPSDPTPLLEALAPDIHALWTDPAVRALLKRRGVHLEHSAGFFLNDVMRISKPGWKPVIDDIVRARLRTFGVEEHRFAVDNSSEWYIYDVGGSRWSRHQWVPYFDDVQAIIFLAPLVFNQLLEEDRSVNRLEDSISLWKQVCTSPLLAKASIILFLNKMDILQSTLKAGVRVQTFVPTYGSQPNDFEHVVKYFHDKFRAYHRRLSPKPRTFFCHQTSAIDTAATQAVLSGVREGILRGHLEKLSVI